MPIFSALEKQLSLALRWQRLVAYLRQARARRHAALATYVSLTVLFYPGFLSTDSVGQLLQAREGVLSDNHPPLMAHIWRLFELVVSGPFPMLLLQLALIVGGVWLVVSRTAVSRTAAAPLIIVSTLWMPPVLAVLGVIWKDILMAGFFISGFGVAMRARQLQGATRHRGLLLAVALAWLAVLMRHNAIGGAFGLLGLVFFVLFEQKVGARRWTWSLVLAGISSLAIFSASGAINAKLADRHESFWQLLAMYDLSGISKAEKRLVFEDAVASGELDAIFKIANPTYQNIMRAYSPHYIAPIYTQGVFQRTTDPATLESLRNAWLGAIKRHPGAYIDHRWRVFRYLIGVDNSNWNPHYMKIVEREHHSELLLHAHKLSPLQKAVESVLANRRPIRELFLPVFWLVLTMVLVGVGLAVKLDDHLTFFLAFSGLGYQATLLFGAGSPDFRYSHWMILSAWLALQLLGVHTWTQLQESGKLGSGAAWLRAKLRRSPATS